MKFQQLVSLCIRAQKRLREVVQRKDGKFRTGYQQTGKTRQLALTTL
jgi:hypothetical protein